MALYNFAPAYHKDASEEELLERLNPYIIACVERLALRSNVASPAELNLELDELAQRARIKLWQALRQRFIENPEAYIKRIVYTEFIDMMRQHKPALPLPVDEEGELNTGNLIVTPREGMLDPASEFEQEEAVATLLARTADAVLSLPPRQQRAMIYSLIERVDDVPQLVGAFKERQVDITQEDWPDNKSDMLRLKASLSVARMKVGQYVGVRLSEHMQQGASDKELVVQRPETFPADGHQSRPLDQRDGELQVEGVKDVVEIEAYVDKLCEPYRTAVRLHYVKKYTYPQVAKEMNRPIGTVKSHVSRGMKMFRELLEQKNVEQDQNGESEAETEKIEIAARVDDLDEPYRTAVRLHYVKKYTYPQVAKEMNRPIGTVKARISRGMKMLRRSA